MLIIAILIICIANIVRTERWKLFIQSYEKPNDRNLIQSLSLGYFINYFVPFKLGDIVRAFYAGHKMKNGYGFSMATVIIDRCLDIITVGLIFGVLSIFDWNENSESVMFYVLLAAILLIVLIIGWVARKYVKKTMKVIASVFNTTIEFKLLKFCWSLIWSFTNIIKKINKLKLLMYTVVMWGLYLLSYFCFASFISNSGFETSWKTIFYMLFAKSSMRVGGFGVFASNSIGISGYYIYFMIYMVIPLVILFAVSLFGKPNTADINTEGDYLNLIPHLDEKERLQFLELYFTSEHSSYIQNYLKINQNVLIIRDYSAGSNATTMLCMNNGKNFFRKYAFGTDGDKLYEQIKWLQNYKDVIPLPDILQYEKENEYCYYDMPYNSNAVGLFEYAHSMPSEKAWNFIEKAFESLENTIYMVDVRKADEDTIRKYIDSKVNKNVDKIRNSKFIKPLMEYEYININGVAYRNLPYYLKYLSIEKLLEIFRNDSYAQIHGDMTIENIICTRDSNGKDDFYIIDPNTGNLHESPNLDYAKMLQSIHGGYEFLMATSNVDVEKNNINFIFTKSDAYTYLYDKMDHFMTDRFTAEQVKSIYYHEIIHWLRLMPYKIEKNGKRALIFYAGTLMVMNDVIKRFEEQ
jgi:hypothetical protein